VEPKRKQPCADVLLGQTHRLFASLGSCLSLKKANRSKGIERLAILVVAASFAGEPDFSAERVPIVRGSSVC